MAFSCTTFKIQRLLLANREFFMLQYHRYLAAKHPAEGDPVSIAEFERGSGSEKVRH